MKNKRMFAPLNQELRILFLITVFLFIGTIEILPQAGQLDTTFGQGGIVSTAVTYFGSTESRSAVIQNDGKIVAAGSSRNGNNEDFAIFRYYSDGTPDNTFGTNGIAIADIGSTTESALSVAIQSDGKIVAGGDYYDLGEHHFVVVRYDPNGALDNTFGNNGIVVWQNGYRANSVAIQNDGKILAAGSFDNAGNLDFAIVRYNSDGSLDNTFGPNGIITTPIGLSQDEAYSLAIQSDGKILTAGYSHNGSNFDFAIARYNPNGALDNTFGSGGIVTTPSTDKAYSIALQSDGKIVVAGTSLIGADNDFAIARYNPNGILDNTFGINGITTANYNMSDIANSVQIQADGKIVINGNNGAFTTIRYNSNGSLDNTFGINGMVRTPIPNSISFGYSVAIQSDAKIVVAGYAHVNSDYNIVVIRYNQDGTLDPAFANFGILTTPEGLSQSECWSIATQSDGKIVVAGYSDNVNDNDFAVVRYNQDGSLDNTFGTNGIVTTQIGGADEFAYSLAIQNDGKVVAGGYYYNGNNYDFAAVRYNTNGFLDNSFGTNGIAVAPNGGHDQAYSTVIQDDGKILLAGNNFAGGNYDITLVRFNSIGTLDNTFGTNGRVTTQIGNLHDFASSVALQTDGKIIVAGYYYNSGNYDVVLARYLSNGSLDNTFGANGIAATPVGNANDYARSVSIQSDGKILATGYTSNGTDLDFAILRFNSNGMLDNSFGSNGIVTTPIGSSDDRAFSGVLQNDGKIVAVGYSDAGDYDDFAFARYNPDGSLDNTFGTNGILTTAIGASNNRAVSAVPQTDGNIIAAGYSNNGSNYSVFTLARYIGGMSCTPGLFGDINADDAVNSTDALVMLSYDAGLPIPQTFLDRINVGFGDVDTDTNTNSTDALLIISYDVGLSVPFPVGDPVCL